MDNYSSSTLDLNLSQLQEVAFRKLIPAFAGYILSVFSECREAVLSGEAPYDGPYGDLMCMQYRLREIRELNAQQIVAETEKIVNRIQEKNWPLSDVIATILYIKSMILSSIREPTMNEPIFVPIPSVETFVHTCLCILARKVFDYPSMVKRFPDDDEQTVYKNRRLLRKCVRESIEDAFTDLTPSTEIVNKYMKHVLQNVHQESEARVIKETDKYGFQDADAEHDDDDQDYDDDDLSASDGSELSETESDDVSELDDDEDASDVEDKEEKHAHRSSGSNNNRRRHRTEPIVEASDDEHEKHQPPPPLPQQQPQQEPKKNKPDMKIEAVDTVANVSVGPPAPEPKTKKQQHHNHEHGRDGGHGSTRHPEQRRRDAENKKSNHHHKK